MGLVWSVPISSKGHEGVDMGAGKTYCRWGGPKPIFGEGSYIRSRFFWERDATKHFSVKQRVFP